MEITQTPLMKVNTRHKLSFFNRKNRKVAPIIVPKVVKTQTKFEDILSGLK